MYDGVRSCFSTSWHSDEDDACAPIEMVYAAKWRKGALLLVVLSITSTGGTVYGWPSLRATLRRDGQFAQGCEVNVTAIANATENGASADSAADPAIETLCTEQELRFGVIFTVGNFASQAGRLPLGVFADRFGPRIAAGSAAVAFACGTAIFALTSSLAARSFAYFIIGAAGGGVQLATQSVSSLFHELKSTVMAMLSGAFQLATVSYLIIDALHSIGVSLAALLLGHAALAIVQALVLFALLPSRPFGTAVERGTVFGPRERRQSPAQELGATSRRGDGHNKVQPAEEHKVELPDSGGGASRPGAEFEPAADMVEGEPRRSETRGTTQADVATSTFWEQLRSKQYVLAVTYFAMLALPCSFTVATIGPQLERALSSSDNAVAATRFFSGAFSFSFLWTPFIGFGSDRLGFRFTFGTISATLLACMGCLLLMPVAGGAVYPAALLYAYGRVGLFATYFGVIAHAFGFEHFGKLVGLGTAIAASVSLLQYPMLDATLQNHGGDFTAANCALAGVVTLSAFLVPGLTGRSSSASALQRNSSVES